MLKVFSLDFSVGDTVCELVTINPHNIRDPESHQHFQHRHSGWEIHYVKQGVLTLDCIHDSYRLTAGQVLIIPTGVYHYVRSVSADIDCMDLLLEIGKGQRSKTSPLGKYLQGLYVQRPIQPQMDTILLDRIQRIVTEDAQDDFIQKEWLKVLCMELVLQMAQITKMQDAQSEFSTLENTDLSANCYIMDQFFNHNFHGNSSMADLAREMNMSVRQTSRILQKSYGKGFREKMNECRLAVALDLICNTNKSMAEIAEILGYGEPANFSYFIKKQTGATPAQIRKSQAGKSPA